MNSAGKVIEKRMRKIQKLQYPRLLRRKLASRRFASGEKCLNKESPLDSVEFCCNLNAPYFKIDARINNGIGNVSDQLH